MELKEKESEGTRVCERGEGGGGWEREREVLWDKKRCTGARIREDIVRGGERER